MPELSHLDETGRGRMVDVSGKETTRRRARATGTVRVSPQAFAMVETGTAAKGDVLAVANVAGVQGAKRTADLVPLCHPLSLDQVALTFSLDPAAHAIHILAEVKTDGKTGVEMEALTAVAVAALTIYDMLKAVDQGITITDLHLLEKTGGKSDYRRDP